MIQATYIVLDNALTLNFRIQIFSEVGSWGRYNEYFSVLVGQRRREDRPLSEAFPTELVHGRHLFRSCEADILSHQTWQRVEEPHVRKSGGPTRCGQKYGKEFKH